ALVELLERARGDLFAERVDRISEGERRLRAVAPVFHVDLAVVRARDGIDARLRLDAALVDKERINRLVATRLSYGDRLRAPSVGIGQHPGDGRRVVGRNRKASKRVVEGQGGNARLLALLIVERVNTQDLLIDSE